MVTYFHGELGIIPDSDPVLHAPVPEFLFSSDIDRVSLCAAMFHTMRQNNAIGLAANQCGLQHRMFVMDVEEVKLAAFNPEIEIIEPEKVLMAEGCISYPRLTLSIKRPASVRLHYLSEHGIKHSIDLSGWAARCAQHETDHLNGIVFVDLVSKLKLVMARKKMR